MIDLSSAMLIGTGGGRDCFLHPRDPTLVVKVERAGGDPRRQFDIERLYFTDLQRRQVPFDHLARFHGVAATTRGPGLLFERIVDDGGTPSRRIAEVVRSGELAPAAARLRLVGLYDHLRRHAVVISDGGADNLLWQRRSGGDRLVFIDGLGARRLGPRFWLYRHSRLMARYKLAVQWRRLLVNLAVDAGLPPCGAP